MSLELEELVNNILVLYVVENISCQSDYVSQRLIQKVALETKLKLTDVFASNALIIQVEQLGSNRHWIDVLEAHREEHLTVTVQFFKHVRVAIFEDKEELLDSLEDEFFGLGWVDPLRQVVKQVLFELLAVFFATELLVN